MPSLCARRVYGVGSSLIAAAAFVFGFGLVILPVHDARADSAEQIMQQPVTDGIEAEHEDDAEDEAEGDTEDDAEGDVEDDTEDDAAEGAGETPKAVR